MSVTQVIFLLEHRQTQRHTVTDTTDVHTHASVVDNLWFAVVLLQLQNLRNEDDNGDEKDDNADNDDDYQYDGRKDDDRRGTFTVH